MKIPRGCALKYVKALILLTCVCLILLALAHGRQAMQDTQFRMQRSHAIALASSEDLRARYVANPGSYGIQDSAVALSETLVKRGWFKATEASSLPMAWCQATGKGAFFRHGWIWVSDSQGRVLRTIWFEPDLKADGQLQWSEDGTQLRLRADGWKRWLNLELEPLQPGHA
jgi:hypothetical protein